METVSKKSQFFVSHMQNMQQLSELRTEWSENEQNLMESNLSFVTDQHVLSTVAKLFTAYSQK